jgi:hypothetical protein
MYFRQHFKSKICHLNLLSFPLFYFLLVLHSVLFVSSHAGLDIFLSCLLVHKVEVLLLGGGSWFSV